MPLRAATTYCRTPPTQRCVWKKTKWKSIEYVVFDVTHHQNICPKNHGSRSEHLTIKWTEQILLNYFVIKHGLVLVSFKLNFCMHVWLERINTSQWIDTSHWVRWAMAHMAQLCLANERTPAKKWPSNEWNGNIIRGKKQWVWEKLR